MANLQSIMVEQQQYYDDRALEYDDWWYRRNKFDEGAQSNANWFNQASVAMGALRTCGVAGDVLELAGGTGIWSKEILPLARKLTIVDGSEKMLALNSVREENNVTLVLADIFKWDPKVQFDSIVFTFWISHVPYELLEVFFGLLAKWLKPGGTFYFVDNCPGPEASAPHVAGKDGQLMIRRLSNGETRVIVKNYYSRSEIEQVCERTGFLLETFNSLELFQYGFGKHNAGRTR